MLDLRRVFAVETLGLLVELGVPLVDVVDVGVVVVGPASAVLGALLDPGNGTEGSCVTDGFVLSLLNLAFLKNKTQRSCCGEFGERKFGFGVRGDKWEDLMGGVWPSARFTPGSCLVFKEIFVRHTLADGAVASCLTVTSATQACDCVGARGVGGGKPGLMATHRSRL